MHVEDELQTNGLKVSRFNMWRAVFAMAHADHVVTEEEKEFIRHYIDNIPFSDEQRAMLWADSENPPPVRDVFEQISDLEDRGDFFQFASMLCWCDGDFDEHERALEEKLKAEQMSTLDMKYLGEMVRKTREIGEIERSIDAQAYEDSARGLMGLGAFLKLKKDKRTGF